MTPKRARRRLTAEFIAKVALAALTERQPLAELATRYQLTVAQISRWKLRLREQAAQVFLPATGRGCVSNRTKDYDKVVSREKRLSTSSAGSSA